MGLLNYQRFAPIIKIIGSSLSIFEYDDIVTLTFKVESAAFFCERCSVLSASNKMKSSCF